MAQGTSASKSELRLRVDKEAPQLLKQYNVPSVAIGYIENGKLAWTAVYGEQSPGVPASERTLYNVASLTKPISAEVVLRLASAGNISLDEPVFTYWTDPDIKDNPWRKLLTARLCLSHQTGFSNWRYQTGNVLRFQWEPGTRTGYSGEGYEYVARFVEKKMGRPFDDLAKQYVFEAVGMHDTSYTAREWFAGRVAVPHGPNGDREPEVSTTRSAADRLYTTIGDYSKFVVSVMDNEGLTKEIAAQRLTITRNQVTPADQAEVCTQRKPEQESHSCKVTAGLGLGWEIIHINDETIVDHSGADLGVHTLAFFLPQRKMGVVIFTNGENGVKVIREIVQILYPNPVYLATL